jgi:hypothetical protein
LVASDWTLGDHWSLLLVKRSEENDPALFLHIDSLSSHLRSASLDVLIERIKEHILVFCNPEDADDSYREDASHIMDLSRTFHSDNVTTLQQAGYWECGYFVMFMIQVITKADCKMMKTLSANTTTVVLTSLFRGFDAEAYRASLAKTAFETAISQRGRWIDNTCLADSTLWIPCHVLKIIDFGEFGTWHRLSYMIGKNVCVILCQLPTESCTYWKHTN